MARYILRFDDIAPNMRWDNFDRLVRVASEFGVRPLLGVIPDNQDPELLRFPKARGDFWDEIRRRQDDGWEVALHGYQHRYVTDAPGLLRINRRSEFAGLPYDEQREKLERGMEILQTQGVTTRTFMAPAHSFDHATLRAVRAVGLKYVTDGYGLFPFEAHGLVFVPQLFGRPMKMPAGVHTACIHLNEASEREMRHLERFIRDHHAQIIPLGTAAKRPVNRVWNRAVGLGAQLTLLGVRGLRRRAARRGERSRPAS